MKFSVATSTVLHAAVLTWGLLSVSSPDVTEIELTGVEIDFETSQESVPVQGEKEADVSDTPAPTPTEKPEDNPDAQNVGDAQTDKKSESEEPPAETAVEKSATTTEPDQAVKEPDPVPTEKAEEQPTPATELSPENDPKTDISELLPADETPPQQASEELQQFAALPEQIPVPSAKPRPPKPNTAKTQERQKPEDEPAKKTSDAKKDDQIVESSLIKNNKTTEAEASGGQRKSEEVASLGSRSGLLNKNLSRREEDQLRQKIENCSRGLAGSKISDDLRIEMVLKMRRDGTIEKIAAINVVGGTLAEQKRYVGAMTRAVDRCQPYDFLAAEKYETWSEIVPTFYPAEMFR